MSNQRINWKEYLKQYDLIYETQARVWQDGIPLGNGSLAALAYEPFHLEWTINKNDVWDYRHPRFQRHSMDYLREIVAQDKNYIEEMSKENGPDLDLYPCPKTCGQLRIRFGMDSIYAPGHRISKQLDLYGGTLNTQLDKHLSHPRVTSFICAEENLLVIQARDVSAMTAFHNKVDLYRVPDSQMPDCEKGAEGDAIWLDQRFHDGFRYVMMARIVPKGGKAYRDLFQQTVQKKWWGVIEPSREVDSQIDGEYAVAPVAGDFDIFLTVSTSLEAKDPMNEAKERLNAAVRKGSARLHAEHRRWWARFWTRSRVSLDEPLLEQLWYVSLYNMATVLRGTPVAGLCGLWFGPMDTPSQILPWHGYYTNDYNAQLPIKPVFRVNHPELADGSFQTILQQLSQAKRNARELYGLPGAYFPLATDPTGEDVTSGLYRLVQNSGPYWCVFLWWHYLFTRDSAHLERVAYPIMREVATFFASYLVWHEDENLYHLEISQQPELMYIKYQDPVDTMALLKYMLHATIAAAKLLDRDPRLVRKCQHILDHFPDYARHGNELPPLRGVEPNHLNHGRTLTGLFPCGEFDPEVAPEWEEVCRREIDKTDLWWKNYGCNEGRIGGYTGVVYHIGMMTCRMGMKERTWGHLEDLLKANVKPNGLIGHNSAVLADSARSEANIANIPDVAISHDLDPDPLTAAEVLSGRLMEATTESLDCRDTIFPAMEGPALYLLLVSEMLLQSHNGILRLFPCWPDERDASFVDLRAEGPTLVASAKDKGAVRFVRLTALAPVTWKVKNPWASKTCWMLSSRTGQAVKVKAERYIEIKLPRGETVVLATRKSDLDYEDRMQPRMGETPHARKMTFTDGMLVWLGKPQPSQYYASLEAARRGRM